MDERFFAECERELTSINLFFSQKIAEAQGKNYNDICDTIQTFFYVVQYWSILNVYVICCSGKYHELENELAQFKVVYGKGEGDDNGGEALRKRRYFISLSPLPWQYSSFRFGRRDGAQKEQTKTAQQLKLAFSEFYLSLVLVQNYQQLNATGFRKILKASQSI